MCKTNVDLNECIKKLENNPVHYMSLGSKELFHSNFWAWMLKNDHRSIECFFGDDIKDSDIKNIEREEGKRDITIHLKNDASYIIENKLKSLPNKDQLLKQQGELKSFKGGKITGLVKPVFVNEKDLPSWTFLDYNEISKKIKEYLKKYNDINKRSFIENYWEYLNDLLPVLQLIHDNYNNELITNKETIIKNLEKIKLADICKKINMELLFQKISELNRGYAITNTFNRKEATLACYYEINSCGNNYEIGIQIQGNQFRRFFSRKNDINKSVDLEYELKALEEVGWFRSHAEIITNLNNKRQPKHFNNYFSENKYIMKYQYNYIDDYKFDSLISKIGEDMETAKRLLDKIKNFNIKN